MAKEDQKRIEENLPQRTQHTKKEIAHNKKDKESLEERIAYIKDVNQYFLDNFGMHTLNNLYERLLNDRRVLRQANSVFDKKTINQHIKQADSIRKATKKKIRTTFQRLKSWSMPWRKKEPAGDVLPSVEPKKELNNQNIVTLPSSKKSLDSPQDNLGSLHDEIIDRLFGVLLIRVVVKDALQNATQEEQKKRLKLLDTQLRDYIYPPLAEAHEMVKDNTEDAEKVKKSNLIDGTDGEIQRNLTTYFFLETKKNTHINKLMDVVLAYIAEKKTKLLKSKSNTGPYSLQCSHAVVRFEKMLTQYEKMFSAQKNCADLFYRGADKEFEKDLAALQDLRKECGN